MPNHIHWIYEVLEPNFQTEINHSFLSYTSKRLLAMNGIPKENFRVDKSDRKYQIWNSPSMNVDIRSHKFLHQKMTYIHNNPVAASLCEKPEDHPHCSYKFYLDQAFKPEFLTLW